MDNPLHPNPRAEYDDDYDLVSEDSSIGSDGVVNDNFDFPDDDDNDNDDDDTTSFDMLDIIDNAPRQPSPPTHQEAYSPLQPLSDNAAVAEETTGLLRTALMTRSPIGLAVAAYFNNADSTFNPLFLSRGLRQQLVPPATPTHPSKKKRTK